MLYLDKKEAGQSLHYQIFIEPKGDHLLLEDKWKEDFLMSLQGTAEVKLLWQNRKYKVWGLPFYNDNSKQIFEEAFEEIAK